MSHNNTANRSSNGNGSIRKKPVTRNGKVYTYWEARYTEGFDPGTGKQIQRSITGRTKKEVAEKLREVTVIIDQGQYTAPSKLTLNQWLDTWTATYLMDVKKSTQELYVKLVDLYIKPRLGATKLDALSAPMIQNVYNELLNPSKEGVSPLTTKSVQNIHGVLHRALPQAIQIGYLRVNPSDACRLPKAVKKEVPALEDTQIADFLAAIQDHRHEYLYKITLFTGLRQGEVLGLTWDCVDLEKGTLQVRQQLTKERKKGGKYYISTPKNGKSRILALPPSVIHLFRLQKMKQNGMRLLAGDAWTEQNMVFTNQTGGFLSYRTVYDCFKRIVKEIGLPDTRFHDLRHTYASTALYNGDDIKTVQKNMGHATAAFTMDTYAHVTEKMRRDSADRMEHFIQSVANC